MKTPLSAFSGYGIELEYMIVDRDTLSVLPVADQLLHSLSGQWISEVKSDKLAWSNEIVLHLIELKNANPEFCLEILPPLFQNEVKRINAQLESMQARLMPSAMHPWMNPVVETQLWCHDNADIYRTYDRIFDCKRHGWANLQSMHFNLPFADDAEFSRLHAAIRLVLPILPALTASSPVASGRYSGFMDFRMENYRTHQIKIPASMGKVIPDTVISRNTYQQRILAPMYREIDNYDPDGVLRHEWLNVRGAVARFDRNAIEIRVMDVQECPYADLAIAVVLMNIIKALYDQKTSILTQQQTISTDSLVRILRNCIRDAEQAMIIDREYLELFGFTAGDCEAGELWFHLFTTLIPAKTRQSDIWKTAFATLFEQGPLARRILRALRNDFRRENLAVVYRELCDCLKDGRMFSTV
ncbi:MAG: glutamate--cysteine ligase [Nitrosomonas sp.]|nr:glutamate--cysteine ligase [Nitrosomonas sp.]MCP5252051.1 glutamate--cysteine ligase [Burkholderiales bacterium]